VKVYCGKRHDVEQSPITAMTTESCSTVNGSWFGITSNLMCSPL